MFFILELWLVKNKQFHAGILLYFIYTLILFFVNKKYIITFFVFNLPLLPIIPSDYKLFSLIGPHEIIYGFSFFVLSSLIKGNKVRINKYQKLSIQFVYFLLFMSIYIIIKDIFLGLNIDRTKGFIYIIKNLVRFFIYYASLILLIKIIYFKRISDYVIDGIKYAIVTIPISMLFTKALMIMGAGIEFNKSRRLRILSGEYERFVGFYGAGGDENSVGIFLVAALGFFLALYEKTGNIKEYIVFMGFAVFGILLTGSRTAFLAFVLVAIVFLITNKSGISKILFLFLIIVSYFIFKEQLDLVIQRFTDPSAVAAIDPNDHGRVGKWIYYLNWILNNPETLIIGNLDIIPLNRAPHNYFIYILYHVGIIPLIFFINKFIDLLKLIDFKMKPNSLKNAYYILPFPFILMTVNSFGSSIYLWLFLPIGAYYLINTKKSIY